jgi:hypothetical protein
MYKIIDIKENPELKKEVEAQETADTITTVLGVCDAPNKPGAWIKRWGNHWKNLKDLRADHFQGQAIRLLDFFRKNKLDFNGNTSLLKAENEKLKKDFMKKLEKRR